eukprot:TRINITY_DN1730_c0_g1_i1.p1 TRINITY_DN1730_c0_g1~~TRINITY_DN1730_c0_g1_i1.p1  ORF type:complete len:162 (+),score=39.81 TRINITY_DN1730_c0_g1_i1:60-488(+)
MGVAASSSTFSALAYNNKAYTPDSFLSGLTRYRINLANAVARGQTTNVSGSIITFPDARLIVGAVVFLANYNCINIGKQKQDEMAATIHKRHGWENFECMSAQDQARLKGYVRHEWFYGMMLPESQRFDLEHRTGMPSNSSI